MIWLLGCGAPTPAPTPPELTDVEARVDEPITLSVDADEAHWRFGDGTEAEGPTVEHTWTEGGRFRVQVTTEAGEAEARATVSWTPATVSSSSTLATHEGTLAAVVPDAGTLVLHDDDGTRRLDICERPVSVVRFEDTWAVACEEGAVVFADGPTVALPPHGRPRGAVVHDDAVWVTLQSTGALVAVRPEGVVATEPAPTDPVGLVAAGGSLWTASFRTGAAASLFEGTEAHPLPRDPGPDSDTDSRGQPNLLRLWATPDGQAVYAFGVKANTERGLFHEERPFTHDTTVRAFARPVGRAAELRFDDRDRITAMTGSPDGLRVFALAAGNATVDVFERDTGVRIGSVLDVGPDATGLALVDTTLWVHSDRELRGYDVSDLAAPQVEPVVVDLIDGEDPIDPVLLQGRRIFQDAGDRRMSQVGYISCASCHPDGEHDGQTWDFTERGEGLRNTLTLRATLQGPLHWSANFDELQDFEADIRRFQGGTGFLADADWHGTEDALGPPKAGLDPDLDALAAYIESLAPLASPQPLDDAVTRGEARFHALGCAACHVPPAYTDSDGTLRDVGTLTDGSGQRLGDVLDGLDTPTLRGVWATAPYLHDGSAPTLEDVLQRDTDGLHGPALSQADAADVAAFLRSLE